MRKSESSENTDCCNVVRSRRSRGQVASERRFDNDACMIGQVRKKETCKITVGKSEGGFSAR